MNPPTKAFALLAAVFALGAHRMNGQVPFAIAVEATAGAGPAKGGDFHDRSVIGARLAVSVLRQQANGIGLFGELAADWSPELGGDAVCYISSRGGCQPDFPQFSGPTARIGVIARGDGAETRLGIGGAAYAADGSRVGAMVTQLDVAIFPL
jgi:hypothetical protein